MASLSGRTVWRWLHEEAIRPWQHRCWIFPRAPDFLAKAGIAPFDRLVDQVMTQPPFRNARRVFWIVDNGSSHRGQTSIERLRQRHPHLVSLDDLAQFPQPP